MPQSSLDVTARNTDLGLLHPVVRDSVQKVLADLRSANIPLFVFEAFRSPERQAYLYAQGRTRPGPKVTFAEPWRSYHQYGLAVDLVFNGPGRWTWDEPRKGMWKRMHEIGERHGLMPLSFETPHLQLAGTSSSALLSGVYPAGGDDAWATNLNSAIAGWQGDPAAPPILKLAPAAQTRGRGMRAAAARAAELALAARESDEPGPDKIARIASEAEIANYKWKDRGRAPAGYIQGMALVYARAYARLALGGDPFVNAMAKAESGDSDDALTWYRKILDKNGMTNGGDGPDTLRHLFVLLIGLGMRESSGRYCEGRDRSARNTTAEKAEAGMFQTSYNARSASPLMPRLFDQFRADPHGFEKIFSNGVSCKPRDWENYGSGAGAEFQALSKSCPAFAAEFAAIGLRKIRDHWGPVNRFEVQIRPACEVMLREVQTAVDADPQAYSSLK